jgi:5'-AMP-activated protein kinase regulatory gamma subunit
MSDTAEVARVAAAPTAVVDGSPSPTSIARHGHERIAQPSTFLLPRGQNSAMQDKPLSSVDRDQLSGLVS